MTEETFDKKKSKQSLDGTRLNAFGMNPDSITIIGLDTKDGPEHALYDKRINLPVSEALVLNIMAIGVIEPVIVFKDGDRVLVVAGRQRVRAAREANKRLTAQGAEPIVVPAMAKRGSDGTMLGVMISENELRVEDLLESKLPKLEKYLATGATEEDAAIRFGVTGQTIRNWLALLEAAPAVKKAVQGGLLSATAGAKIASLPRADQSAAVEEATKDGKASVAKAERITKTKKKNAANGADDKTITPPSKRLLRKLVTGGEFQQLDVDAFQVLKWVLGDVETARVKGLTALMRTIEEGPAE